MLMAYLACSLYHPADPNQSRVSNAALGALVKFAPVLLALLSALKQAAVSLQ